MASNEHPYQSPAANLSEEEREELRARARHLNRSRLARRDVLRIGGGASLSALLAACGSSTPASTPTTAPTANISAPVPSAAPNTGGQATSAPATSAPVAAPTTSAAGSAVSPTTAVGSAAAGSPAAGAQMIGKLQVITDPRPKYTGTPTDTTDTLNIIRAEDFSDLNPTALNPYSPYTFVYDPLVWIDEFTLDPLPWLAEKWELSADGKSYTFHLRKDVKWHDGTPFTADDVAFSMITYRDDPESGVARFFPLMKKDPVVIDANTIRFDLDDTSGDWILNASNQFMLQKKQFNDYWNAGKGDKGAKTLKGYDYANQMLIGTGQWKQTKVDFGAAPPFIQYDANENYFQGKPHFAKMIFKDVEKSTAQIASWLNNETDMLWPITATDADQVKNQDGTLYSAYAVAFMNAWINFQNPKSDTPDFLKDKAVRQALSVGIDRKGYAQSIFKGFVDESKIGSIAFPWAYNTNLKSPDFDTKKAGDMLAAAGYKKDGTGNLLDKNGKPIKLVAITNNANQYPVDKIAVSVQEDWKQLGIQMQIDQAETATTKKRWQTTLDYDLYFVSRILFAGFSDLNYYGSDWDVRKTPQGRNFGGWKNDQADKLLQQIIREPDLKKQKDLLWSFQQIIADDMPAFWFGFPRDLILVKKNILGYQPNAMWQYWDNWKMWKTK
jgi:peptide/nickel transport system substrate-binding protein